MTGLKGWSESVTITRGRGRPLQMEGTRFRGSQLAPLHPGRADCWRFATIRRISMAKKTAAAAKSPAKKPTAKATATQPVVTLKHIAAQVAEAHELPLNRAVAMLNDIVSALSKHLVKGDKV